MTNRSTAHEWLVGVALVGCAVLGACASAGSESTGNRPATVRGIAGTDVRSVTLTADAEHRIDLHVVPVTETARGGRAIPYSAVFYDPNGATWTFTNTEGRTFLRQPITVTRIDGDTAFLSKGPEPGTKVVTVGGPELYGAELGVGDDE